MFTMKYAILGDVHGNWEALSAVLADARQQGVDAYACVGDIVGYNPDPLRCVDALRELNCESVRGNHDHFCALNLDTQTMSEAAAVAIQWTRKQLDKDAIGFLSDLPFVHRMDGFTIVHNTLERTERWNYVLDIWSAAAHFRHQRNTVCFHGHTHVPVVFRKHGAVSLRLFENIKIGRGTKYFVNVGSVGQPRDRNPQAAYVLYDTDNHDLDLRRVAYDLQETRRKITAAKLPDWLGIRLMFGV